MASHENQIPSPIPEPTSHPNADGGASPPSSASSSSEAENEVLRKSRVERPRLTARQKSSTIIVPKGTDVVQAHAEYPPDDARAMSPRRTSADVEKLGQEARQSLKDHVQLLQSSLAALAERIDEVKSDHDKLESENKFLQDYIGGLTRTMSKGEIGSTSGSVKGKK